MFSCKVVVSDEGGGAEEQERRRRRVKISIYQLEDVYVLCCSSQ